MTAVLSIQNLSKSYSGKMAVENLNFELHQGQIYGILGPNGSGKTTTLGMVLGVLRPTNGNIQWFGKKNVADSRKKIGSLLEQPNFYPWLSCEKNLQITSLHKGSQNKSEIETRLKEVGLYEVRNRPFAKLSLGMKQRLALANCLIGDPEVLILDEPTNGIDAQGIVDIRNIIKEQGENGRTIILASHILDEVEKVCSHTLILKEGKVISDGPIQSVLGGVQVVRIHFSESGPRSPSDEEIHSILSSLNFIESFNLQGKSCVIELKPDAMPYQINQAFFDKGFTLNQLESTQGGLEKQFVRLLEEQE